ncbi:GNAT family N-acetyltransferase [Sphingomonas sp. URHD0057]|uniref:GNAT family N-acetyltransferase n=1 Tax=Sphingomonas sp. URHD0057 TaxID=1380389 RepID=UPI000490697D|nr:GNAT family N-acetyltransferase [Sphingomonas sp. URHD0057]
MTTIRAARTDDAEAIAAIYAHHVLHGTASFEEEPPTMLFWRDKLTAVLSKGWPFLVTELDGEVIGYAYATQFRDRPAYAHTCENSIYVHHQHLGKGIGRELLERLIGAARDAGFRQMIGVIGGGEPASVALHRTCGFGEAGRMRSVGFKFGQWLDTVYMQLSLIEKDLPNG